MSNATRVEKVYQQILLDMIKMSNFQKAGTKTAQLRQTVVTTSFYPSKQASDSLSESFYDNNDFGFAEQPFTSTENRVTFINIPLNETEDGLKAKLAANPNAHIQRILSHHPILSSQQENAISRGLKTLDEFADRQALRYGKGHEMEGQLILINGRPSFRVTKISASGAEDIDTRNKEIAEGKGFYMTEKMKEEMEGVETMTSVSEDSDYHELESAGTTGEDLGEQTM